MDESAGALGQATRERINLEWLLRLRWAAVLVQTLTIAGARLLLGMELPLGFLGIVVALEAVSNVAASWWHRRDGDPRVDSESLLAVIMALDIGFLTALLFGSGGPFNPFSVFYLIHISLAAATLRPRLAWSLTLLSVCCFGGLFVRYVPIPALEHHGVDSTPSAAHSHAPSETMHIHLRGMLLAFAGAAVFVTYFVTRVRHELDQRDAQLAAADRRRAHLERLDSLVTLAAGAAHELATPLATVMVAAREMELELTGSGSPLLADIQVMVREIGRCRDILGTLTSRAGERMGETWRETPLSDLLADARLATRQPDSIVVVIAPACSRAAVVAPRRALTQTLGALLQNGLDASSDPKEVRLLAACESGELKIEVQDSGRGMSDSTLRRLGEPFYSTRQGVGGMGLGVFLAKRVVEQIGGSVVYESKLGSGTTVRLTVPLEVVPASQAPTVACRNPEWAS
jgi:two-component system sensor histidine kinase RegB